MLTFSFSIGKDVVIRESFLAQPTCREHTNVEYCQQKSSERRDLGVTEVSTRTHKTTALKFTSLLLRSLGGISRWEIVDLII